MKCFPGNSSYLIRYKKKINQIINNVNHYNYKIYFLFENFVIYINEKTTKQQNDDFKIINNLLFFIVSTNFLTQNNNVIIIWFKYYVDII